MIAKIKELLSAKNFMGVKISAGVMGAVAIVTTCIVLTGKEEPANVVGKTEKNTTTEISINDIVQNDTTSNMDETSNDVTTDLTTEQIVQNIPTEESLEVIVPVAGSTSSVETTGESGSTSESTTQVSTTIQSNTKNQNITTTEVQTTTVPQTTTQKQTTTGNTTTTQTQTATQDPTTTQPETTTEEETTEPPRAANGVILEQLTKQGIKVASYTIPGSWAQIMEDFGVANAISYSVIAADVPKFTAQNIFGNEIMLYNSENGTGSTPEDVIDIYGTPWYMEEEEEYCLLYYKYLNWDVGEDDRMYARFMFKHCEYEGRVTDKLLREVTFGPYKRFEDDFVS